MARLVAQFGVVDKLAADWMLTAEKLVDKWGVLRFPRNSCGERSYAFFGSLVDIERAILNYAFDFIYKRLKQESGVFRVEPVHVDDILPISTTRACGLQQRSGQHPIQYRVFHEQELFTAGNKNQYQTSVSQLDFISDEGLCLSGTAEMGIAEKIKGRVFCANQLPTYFIAESCCYRPEANSGTLEGGIYRVHEFKKIEMFVVCTEKQSACELNRIVQIQRDLFTSLELHCRILDMPTEELGPSAARKFDIEAWMPGRQTWGEVTSASNCTDYQSRRLHLRYQKDKKGQLRYVHTCNGTGLASTRTLIALLETKQNHKQGIIDLPPMIRQKMPTKRSPVLRCAKAAPIKYCFD